MFKFIVLASVLFSLNSYSKYGCIFSVKRTGSFDEPGLTCKIIRDGKTIFTTTVLDSAKKCRRFTNNYCLDKFGPKRAITTRAIPTKRLPVKTNIKLPSRSN